MYSSQKMRRKVSYYKTGSNLILGRGLHTKLHKKKGHGFHIRQKLYNLTTNLCEDM